MKKSINLNKIYQSLSKNESALLNAVDDFVVFSVSIIKKITTWKHSTISNTLSSLKKKGIVASIKKDHYAVSSKITENIFSIATAATSPSYISFWTACSLYGLTEQHVKTVQVVSTKQYSPLHISGFTIEAVTFKPTRFYGYHTFQKVAIAEKEKLIIDILCKPENSGGMEEVKKCIARAWQDINKRKLNDYLKKFNNRAIYGRLGYLLGELKLRYDEESYLKHIPSSYTKLNPKKSHKKQYNKKWRIIVND